MEGLLDTLGSMATPEGFTATPEDLGVDLLPFQQQGLSFLVRREQAGHGGILADDSEPLWCK